MITKNDLHENEIGLQRAYPPLVIYINGKEEAFFQSFVNVYQLVRMIIASKWQKKRSMTQLHSDAGKRFLGSLLPLAAPLWAVLD